MRVITGAEINGHKITCRYGQPEDEQVYTGESWNTWEEVRKRQKVVKKPQKEVKKLQKEVKKLEKEVKKPEKEVIKLQKKQPANKAVVLISNLPPDSTKVINDMSRVARNPIFWAFKARVLQF